jgi:hypothetical protein
MLHTAGMRTSSFFGFLALVWINSLLAQDIVFTNKTATFTNLQGRVYTNVTLVKATQDGLLWRGDSMGLIAYTNLSPALLESLGVPTNRIEQARERATQAAAARAKQWAAQAQAQARAQPRAGNAPGQEREVEVVKLEASLSAGRYKKCTVRRGGDVLIQRLPAAVEAALNDLGQQAAQIEYTKSWIENFGKVLRHTEAAYHDANMRNSNNPNAPYYYVKETAYASLEDAKDELSKLQSAYAESLAKTREVRTLSLKSAGSYGDSPVWECTGSPKPQ